MPRGKPIAACDCETDPFLAGRIPQPFLWGLYDGKNFHNYDNTGDFVSAVCERDIILYAHNGGKFDFIYLLPFIKSTKAQIINGRIVAMKLGKCELRDSFATVPVGMGQIQKMEMDVWKMENNVRHLHMPEIIERNRTDCVYLYNLMKTYRDAAGKQKTIASNALSFAKRLGIDPGKTNHRFDAQYRPFYYGGRTECFQPGTHKNLTLLDIHSAYPFAMMHNHATGDEFRWKDDLSGMTREEIQRAFIVLECTAKGCFPMRTKGAGGLMFPHEYNQFHVTGWEYIAALDLGLISDVNIQSVRYTKETINFAPYVKHWYDYKARHDKKTDPINYTIGKIMMNSLYGKLAQNPARYCDYKIVEAGTPICRVPDLDTLDNCRKCGDKGEDHGWNLEREYEGHEIHVRESLWKWKYNFGAEWQAKKLYKNVATGASITGFTRAHLLRAMHALGMNKIVYCDTDGIACLPGADLSAIAVTENIGDWEIEDQNAPVGHFAGKKLYGIQLSKTDPKTGKHKEKIASKGARLTFKDVERVTNGETIRYENQAPTFHIDGTADFIVRNIRSTAIPAKS